MSLAVEQENRFVTYTDWQGYLKYLEAVGDGRTRVTFDRGKLELLSPSNEHEEVKSILGRLLEAYLVASGREFKFGGSTTFKRKDLERGLEPDECYWIVNWARVRGRKYDMRRDPPPDLVIEVDITSSSIDRIELYRSMGVPEIWRYRKDGRLDFLRLKADLRGYEESSCSVSFPELEPGHISAFLARRNDVGMTTLLRDFQRWAASHLGEAS